MKHREERLIHGSHQNNVSRGERGARLGSPKNQNRRGRENLERDGEIKGEAI